MLGCCLPWARPGAGFAAPTDGLKWLQGSVGAVEGQKARMCMHQVALGLLVGEKMQTKDMQRGMWRMGSVVWTERGAGETWQSQVTRAPNEGNQPGCLC